MSPELSRQLGQTLGRHWVYPQERDRVIAAALAADTYEQLPAPIRLLVEQIGRRGAAEPKGAR